VCAGPWGAWLGEESLLPRGWKARSLLRPASQTRLFQFLSPENVLFHSPAEVMEHVRRNIVSSQQQEEEAAKRKPVIINQVMMTRQTRLLIQKALTHGPDVLKGCLSRDLVVFVPRLACIVKGVNGVEEQLNTSSDAIKLSIPINCIHSDEGRPNNIPELLQELKERQIEYDMKVKEEIDKEEVREKEVEGPLTIKEEEQVMDRPAAEPQRSLRCRLRHNYEETTPQDEELFNTYVKPGGRAPAPPPPAPPVAPLPAQNDNAEALEEDEDTYGQHFFPNGRERVRFARAEILVMEQHFDRNPYPNRLERRAISQLLRLPAKNVRIWFQNKRNKTEDGKMKCFFVRNNISLDGSSVSKGAAEKEKEEKKDDPDDEDTQFCQPCGKAFSTRWNYKVHRRKFHQHDAVGKFKCKNCGQGFDTQWNLKTHLIQHHGKLTGRLVLGWGAFSMQRF